METIKQNFSIKDLEHLSGIKAHTIRMWEKRYGVLKPNRTDTNIRTYSVNGLQKILNIAFLNENGYKISRISTMSDEAVNSLVKRITTSKSNVNRAVQSMKVAMMNFDQPLFLKTYDGLLTSKTFRDIYNDVFLPLLEQIGYLWQSNTITPAHEQFISNLIKQKLFINIESLQKAQPIKEDKVFVLFLPEEEIHDIGLYYTNYELLSHGYKVIFLGQSLPMEDLSYLSKLFTETIFISYLTTKPENLDDYINRFTEHICVDKKCEYWVLGKKAQTLLDEGKKLPERVKAFSSINHLTFNL